MSNDSARPEDHSIPARRTRYYRPELDILRFTAAALVVQFHLVPSGEGTSLPERCLRALHRSGACGVCLFFLLSAFLITELFFREIEQTSTIHIPSFYVRRILRIWPLFFFFLLLAFIFSVISPKAAIPHSTLIAFLLLVGNWNIILHGWPLGFIQHLWSISIEEQFYAVWPAIVKTGGRKAIAACSIFFWCLAYITLLILGARRSTFSPAAWLNSLVQFQFFAIGAILALLLHRRSVRLRNYIRIIFFAAGLAALTLANPVSRLLSADNMPGTYAAIPGYLGTDIGCVLLFLSLLGTTPPAWSKPFVYLGKISYGLYVFHIFVRYLVVQWIGAYPRLAHPDLLIAVLSIPLTVAVSMLSYHLLESPFLRLKKRFTFIPSREV